MSCEFGDYDVDFENIRLYRSDGGSFVDGRNEYKKGEVYLENIYCKHGWGLRKDCIYRRISGVSPSPKPSKIPQASNPVDYNDPDPTQSQAVSVSETKETNRSYLIEEVLVLRVRVNILEFWKSRKSKCQFEKNFEICLIFILSYGFACCGEFWKLS